MEKLKYDLVSIDTMNTQINVRLPEELLSEATKYAEKKGFGNIQDLIKEALREKLFEPENSRLNELKSLMRLLLLSEKKNLKVKEKKALDKLKDDLIFSIRTEQAWKRYDEGEFKSMDYGDFLKEVEKW
jgi:Arc/MetJ-type ribon-helix-helix transcriptional regulator